MYDAQIGRFHTQDRFAEKYYDFSPYQYTANNPILFIDINGDSIIVGESLRQNKATLESYNNWLMTDEGKFFQKLFGEGGKFEKIAVEFNVKDFTGKDTGTKGRTTAFSINNNTSEKLEIITENEYQRKLDAGEDVSGFTTSVDEDSRLKFDITVQDVTGKSEFVKANRQETFTHEGQHVRITRYDISKHGKRTYSVHRQHDSMNRSQKYTLERINTLRRARPDLSEDALRKAVKIKNN